MKRLARLFKSCFGPSKVDFEEEDTSPILLKEPRKLSKRPPKFPKEPQEPPVRVRPRSPFEGRLKILGQKIEEEVRKECAPSRQSSRDDASELPSRTPSGVLSTSDSVKSLASVGKLDLQKAVAFPSLEVLEADCYRNLMEEQMIAAGPICFRTPSYTSSVTTLSPRDWPQNQYLFYEDEEDVVMEFLPTLQEIRQVC